ncbi:hypothetical protein CEQ90_03550 [Lewinellaceae bacterium SD302]|nr:hypothetical protein CEQ90_03550 [Lewinellaceae bacterium SD302]
MLNQDCSILRYLLLLSFLLSLGTAPSAQVLDPADAGVLDPDDPDFDPDQDRRRQPQEQRQVELDTFGVFAFQVSNPNEETAFRDSLLDDFQAYDESRKVPFDYGTTGIVGGAAYPLLYRPRERLGLDLGLHQFDLYQRTGRTMSFYRQQRPYTNLKFVEGSEQRDIIVGAQFSRNFADGVNFVMDYHRISQRGQSDQYPNQNLRNTHVNTGFWIDHKKGKYDAFLSFAANTYEQNQNGGLSALPNVGGDFDTPLSAEVYLEDGFLRQAHRQWMITQYLQFGGRTDSLGRTGRAYTLSHEFELNNFYNRLTVPFNENDTLFQEQRFPNLSTDIRGQRSVFDNRTIQNAVRLSTFRRGKSGDRATVQKDVLELGLIHQIHRLRQEPGDSTINNLMATARVGFRPSDRFRVVADGRLNLADQLGDFQVKAAGQLDLERFGKLELDFFTQLSEPTVIDQVYNLTELPLYRNDFDKVLETRLAGAITLPVVNIRTGLAYNLITNYIYRDTSGLPQQIGAVQNILQLTAEKNIKIGVLNINNRMSFQLADRDEIRLPKFMGEHSIFYGGKWFGVLNVQFGVDLRYFDGFRPYYYNPVVQQFQLQDDQQTDFFLQADAFFSMRVTRFRFFYKWEQVNQLWSDDLLYLVADNPFPDLAGRLGISWRLID